MKRKTQRKWISRILLITTIILMLSGFGITHYWIIEPATFGLLGKNESFRIHTLLWGPFLALLIIHIYLAMIPPEK